MAFKTYQGKYQVVNRSKYIGAVDNVIFRSNWERIAFKWADMNPRVLKWNSEEVVIPYICATDGRSHRYFMDMAIHYKKQDGTIKKFLIEIKPRAQTHAPKAPKNNSKKALDRYLKENQTWMKNQSKWKTTEQFCKKNGWEFMIMDEYALGIKK